MFKVIHIIFGVSLLVIAGCTTYTIPEYKSSFGHMSKLKNISENSSPIALGSFSSPSDQNHVGCRGAGVYVSPPNKMTYANYIKQALQDELEQFDLYDPNATT